MPAILFQKFVASILAVYSGPGHAPRTAAKMRHVLDLVQAMEVRTTADLTTELIARFVAARSTVVKTATVRGDLSYLSAACTYAVEEGWLDRAPRFKRVRPRPAKPAAPRCHSIEDVGRVLDHLRSQASTWEGGRLYALAAVVAYTGLRRDEALYLRTEDVNITVCVLRIVARRRLKTLGSEASVPMPTELVKILETWVPRTGSVWLFPGVRRVGPWTGGTCGERAGDVLKNAAQMVGVEGFTLLSLRHTFATLARRRWGLSAIEVATILRHSTVNTQSWYVHDDPDPTAIVRAVANVSYREEP